MYRGGGQDHDEGHRDKLTQSSLKMGRLQWGPDSGIIDPECAFPFLMGARLLVLLTLTLKPPKVAQRIRHLQSLRAVGLLLDYLAWVEPVNMIMVMAWSNRLYLRSQSCSASRSPVTVLI